MKPWTQGRSKFFHSISPSYAIATGNFHRSSNFLTNHSIENDEDSALDSPGQISRDCPGWSYAGLCRYSQGYFLSQDRKYRGGCDSEDESDYSDVSLWIAFGSEGCVGSS